MDDMELTHKVSTSEHLLDAFVGKGIVPSWPVFILSVLQASSSAVPEIASYGSYGHLYEALLTKRMADSSKRPSSLGLKYTYLSIIAYELFKNERFSLSEADLRRLHRKYETEYKVEVNEDELWAELAAAQVLVRSGDDFRFQYKYAYYFSVAKYFQQGIGNVEEAAALRSQLSQMVNCVHDEDYANILIFYIYMTKDRVVIEQMLGVAARIFSDTEPANLTTDVAFVNNATNQLPDVLLETSDIERNREEYRSRLDESEDAETKNNTLTRTRYQDNISDVLKIDFAFKSLQVMGQVVKNFPLDLKGDLKLELTRQSYELTLRTMRRFLNFLESSVAEIVNLLERALRMHQPFSRLTNDEIRDASLTAVIRLTELSIFGLIKRLSFTLGVVDLKETYAQVRQIVGEDRIPTRLIDLSIKLDHFGHIPEGDVRDLEQRLRANVPAYTVLKLMVGEFLHLFPCNYKTEQKMVQLFNFQPHIPKLGPKKVKKLGA
jgi:hypothetical protein